MNRLVAYLFALLLAFIGCASHGGGLLLLGAGKKPSAAASIAFGDLLNEHFGSAAATHTTTGTITISAGQAYLVSVLHEDGALESVGDGTNSCSSARMQQRSGAANFYNSLWYCQNVTGGTFSVTVNYAGANTSMSSVLVQVLTGTAAASYVSAPTTSINTDETDPRTLLAAAACTAGNMGIFVSSSGFGAGNTFTPQDPADGDGVWTLRPKVDTVAGWHIALMSRAVTSAALTPTGSVNQSGSDAELVIACFQ